MHFVSKVAFVVSILFLLGACQKATLIPSEAKSEATRATGTATEEPKDSATVKPELDVNDWGEAVNAEFQFGGESVPMANEK